MNTPMPSCSRRHWSLWSRPSKRSRVAAVPVKGCGIDLIEVKRIARALTRPGLRERIYTPRERAELQGKGVESWAARFAAKEAVMKALGRGFLQGVPLPRWRSMRMPGAGPRCGCWSPRPSSPRSRASGPSA